MSSAQCSNPAVRRSPKPQINAREMARLLGTVLSAEAATAPSALWFFSEVAEEYGGPSEKHCVFFHESVPQRSSPS